MVTPKVPQEKQQEEVIRQVEGAERGKYGLKRIPSREFLKLTNAQKREILTEPLIITSDEEDVFVILTVDDYFARVPPVDDPTKLPLMKRFEDKLFREVL